MIYYKIKNQLYNNPESIKNIEKYRYTYNRIKALYRILKNELTKTLNVYPNIDIYIASKNVKRVLGRFTNKSTAEYKRQDDKNPYIVLYLQSIGNYYGKHLVKGLKLALYHEFLHYQQWLLGQKCKHSKRNGLACSVKTADMVNVELIISKKHLQKYNFKAIYK